MSAAARVAYGTFQWHGEGFVPGYAMPAPLMVQFLNLPAHIPFEIGNTDISNLELMAVAAGQQDSRVKFARYLVDLRQGRLHQRYAQRPPAKENRR